MQSVSVLVFLNDSLHFVSMTSGERIEFVMSHWERRAEEQTAVFPHVEVGNNHASVVARCTAWRLS